MNVFVKSNVEALHLWSLPLLEAWASKRLFFTNALPSLLILFCDLDCIFDQYSSISILTPLIMLPRLQVMAVKVAHC